MTGPIRSHASPLLRPTFTVSYGPKNQEPPSQSFLWVNKGSSSASVQQNTKEEKRSIYRHVQQDHFRRQRAEKDALIWNCLARSLVGWASKIELPASTFSLPPSPSPAQNSCSFSKPVEALLQSTSDGSEEDGEYSEDSLVIEAPSVVLCSCLDDAVDSQFDCPLSLLSSQMESLLRLWSIHMELWFTDIRWSKEKQDQVLESWDCLVEGFVSNQLGMHALLAYLATIRETFAVAIGLEGAESTHLIHKALRLLRRHLQANQQNLPVDVRLIRAVYFLCLAEAYRNNEDGYLTHFKMVRFLVDQLGGLESLGEDLKMSIIVSDVYLAAERIDSPIFASSWDPGPFPLEAWSALAVDPALSRLGSGFMHPKHTMVVTPALQDIITSIVELVCVDQPWHSHSSIRQRERDEWVPLRRLGIIHKLSGLQLEQGGPTDALRIALIFWLMLVQTQFGRHRSITLIGPRLKHVLQHCKSRHPAFFSDHSDLLLWILAVGSMICGGANGGGGSKRIVELKWFIKELAHVCKRLQVRTGHQLIKHLRRYLFLNEMCSIGLEITISSLCGAGLN